MTVFTLVLSALHLKYKPKERGVLRALTRYYTGTIQRYTSIRYTPVLPLPNHVMGKDSRKVSGREKVGW